MRPSRTLAWLFAIISICLFSCKKDGSDNGPNNGNCNNTVMKFKKLQSLGDPDDYLAAEWNPDGTPKKIILTFPISEIRNATFVYDGNRIKEAVIRDNYFQDVIDTAIFRYDAGGRVDSMYLKNDDNYNIKLDYVNGKLTKYTHYLNNIPVVYWDVETDANGNVTKAEDWMDSGSGFEKQSTYTFTRDDRKNPLADLAPYMFYLDDAYNIFWYWGPNNYIDQNYQDHTGSGLNLTTGNKFKYNGNCYPESSQTTIGGVPLLNDPDFEYTYY